MQVLSLFDGISCGRVALERAEIPVEVYDAYEIDKNAITISKKNWPDIRQHGDVTAADFTQYEGVDLLMGGSPCQSLSIVKSKTRQHLDGKSRLFFEFVRALEEARPKWFLFENVASMNEESKNVISELLGGSPVFINSSAFSAQSRPRLYWTNIPLGAVPAESEAVLGDVLEPEVDEKYFYNLSINDVDMGKPVCGLVGSWSHEMLRRVYNPAFKSPTLTCVTGGHQQKKVMVNGRARKLTPLEYERLQTLPDNYTAGVSDGARYTGVGNGWTVDVIAWILSHIPREDGVETWML